MKDSLQLLNRQLNALSVFRSILDTPVVSALQKLIYAISEGSADTQISACGAFSKALYEEGGNLSDFVCRYVSDDENVFLKANLSGRDICPAMTESMEADLAEIGRASCRERVSSPV